MASKSNIEWTGFTWNPIAGCSVKSPGCKHCYAMPMAARLEAIGQELYKGLTDQSKTGPVFNGTVRQAGEHVLLSPLRRKKPTTYFVNSMSDLFHENVPDEWIDQIFAVMALCPQHTFQVLTKRAARMREYLSREDLPNRLAWEVTAQIASAWFPDWKSEDVNGPHRGRAIAAFSTWPLPNVWLGVSTERQQEADERIPLLLQTPAAVRFISAEPLLGQIFLTPWLHDSDCDILEHGVAGVCTCREPREVSLDWVIVGGESGKDARPMHPDWVRSLRDQCAAAGVPFFFKQWGEWADTEDWPSEMQEHLELINRADGNNVRVGKKAAGRHLDGVLHDAMPQADGRGKG